MPTEFVSAFPLFIHQPRFNRDCWLRRFFICFRSPRGSLGCTSPVQLSAAFHFNQNNFQATSARRTKFTCLHVLSRRSAEMKYIYMSNCATPTLTKCNKSAKSPASVCFLLGYIDVRTFSCFVAFVNLQVKYIETKLVSLQLLTSAI